MNKDVDIATASPRGRPRKAQALPVSGAASNVEYTAAETEGTTSGKVVGAVVGAIKILRCLADSREPVGVSKIAKDTKLNTSTTFNILRTLLLHDFVQFDRLSKTYTLSLGIMEIARAATAVGGDIGSIRPHMERVAQEHGVTITLWQPLNRDRKIMIMSAQPRNAMRIQMAIGQRLPLLVGSTGRLFAAFSTLTEAEIKMQFDQIRWQNPLSYEQFRAEVEQARQTGWALDSGNFAAGTVLISTVVLDREENAILALTANMFAGQYDPAQTETIVADLKSLASEMARMAPF